MKFIEIILPSLIALIVVYTGYKIWIKQKLYEENNEKLRKIRQSISNLLLIWKELSTFEKSLNPQDPYSEILFKNSKLLRKFLKIDELKISRLKSAYLESIENLKDIDISIFYNLESNFEQFNTSYNEFLTPIFDNKSINISNKYQLIFPILQDNIRNLEQIIVETSENLPKKEFQEVEEILHNHSEEINNPNFGDEAPTFLLRMINEFIPLKEEISKKEFQLIFGNETFKWLFNKALNLSIISILSDFDITELFNFIIAAKDDDDEYFENLVKDFDPKELIDILTLQDEEYSMFTNNKDFYLLLFGVTYKFTENIPFELKRLAVKLNNGEINLKKEIEKIKTEIAQLPTTVHK